jgi:hypothetical protein
VRGQVGFGAAVVVVVAFFFGFVGADEHAANNNEPAVRKLMAPIARDRVFCALMVSLSFSRHYVLVIAQ